MFKMAQEANLSSEKLGKLLGVSGMTLRRWKHSPKDENLPQLYERAFSKSIEQMVVDGQIDPESQLAQSVMTDSRELSFQATLKTMGFTDALLKRKGNPNDALIEGLSQLGSSPSRMEKVDSAKKELFNFAKMGSEWKRYIKGLWNVVRSPKLTIMDKLVAYGALSYPLSPFNLIPNYIPVIGLLDDYAVLGLAMAYYMKRFPEIVAASAE